MPKLLQPNDKLRILSDLGAMDIDWIHRELSEKSYWAVGRSREQMERALEGSVVFGLFRGELQIGFARVVTDRVSVAYLADVWIAEEERGRGLGRRLVSEILKDSRLKEVRRWLLRTKDAHGVYAPLGFGPVEEPEKYMERVLE